MSEQQAVLSKPRDLDSREGGAASGIRSELLKGVPIRARHLNVNGIATSVLEAGSGPPLVLLHGGIECGGVGTFAARFAAQHGHLLSGLCIYGAPGIGRYRMPLGLLVTAIRFDLRPSERNNERV